MNELFARINDFFYSVSMDMSPLVPDEAFHVSAHRTVPARLTITVEQVQKQLESINSRKAPGPDGILNWVLKEYPGILSGPLCVVFNNSLRDGFVPELWKSADVCPVSKVPAPSILETHVRPTSLTTALSMCLESFITDWVKDSLMPVIDPHQFSSLRRSSAFHALVELVDSWH